MIDNRFIYIKNKSDLNMNNINSDSIVFIEDSKEIWTHGKLFTKDYEYLESGINEILTKINGNNN